MNIKDLTSIEEVEQFLGSQHHLTYSIPGKKNERYRLIQRILIRFNYTNLSKKDKGTLTRFLMTLSGYSRAQLVRLIRQYMRTGKILYQPAKGNGFKRKYSHQDIRLLAELDDLHETPCGQAIKKIAERAYEIYGDERYQCLAQISVSHLYNLRQSTHYQSQCTTFKKTQPSAINIGERRKPQPDNQPGFIRIDTVHQGDQDGVKGVYHINAIDEVTQFEVILSVEKISEHYLVPVIEQILDLFPFVLLGFHSDNGSEYVNHQIARLLNKLLIEFTKSRARKSNDNALVESKNGSVVRKLFGYAHIPQQWAEDLNRFNRYYLFPYLNYHRPCFFPDIEIDNKGKQRKRYRYENMMTPYDKLKSLPNSETYLKPGITFDLLDRQVMKMTDNEAALLMKEKKQAFFNKIFEHRNLA